MPAGRPPIFNTPDSFIDVNKDHELFTGNIEFVVVNKKQAIALDINLIQEN